MNQGSIKKSPEQHPVNTWVKAKRSGGKRYVTRHSTKDCFEDDGKVSGQTPSCYCHHDNYEPC